jgi:hypothetical protein
MYILLTQDPEKSLTLASTLTQLFSGKRLSFQEFLDHGFIRVYKCMHTEKGALNPYTKEGGKGTEAQFGSIYLL